MQWLPWKRKSATEAPALPPAAALMEAHEAFSHVAGWMGAAPEAKNFDWLHYQAMSGGAMAPMFAGEFNLIPTMRVMKGMYLQEFWVNACTSTIAKQFLNTRFVLHLTKSGDGQKQKIGQHPLLDFLRDAGSDQENEPSFQYATIADLVLTGNAYWWVAQDLKDKKRIPAERMEPVVENNKIVAYRLLDRSNLGLTGTKATMTFEPEEIVHLRLPNPFSAQVGLSMFIATVIPVLVEKYGMEYVVGFFLRGGQTSGIIETKTSNVEQLMRLARTLMQAFGGRKNMHADKILPDGATWKGQGSSFGEIRLIELLASNEKRFRAATGCTNVVLGIAENVNRATAMVEMEVFWRATILPLQKLICACIRGSSLWGRFRLDSRYELGFDNSEIEWIDDFSIKLEQDAKLAPTWTVNERRERLGKEPIERLEDKLEAEVRTAAAPPPLALSFNGGIPPTIATDAKGIPVLTAVPDAAAELSAWKAEEKAQLEPTKTATSIFDREFAVWEQVVLEHLDSKYETLKALRARADDFVEKLAEKLLPSVMRAYDNQLKALRQAAKTAGGIVTKEQEQDRLAKLADLRERAKEFIAGKIRSDGRGRFFGYMDTQMDAVYELIHAELEAGKSMADVAATVRQRFGQFYEGQAETIVRTEYGSAVSIGQARFGEDLGMVTEEMSKEWIDLDDEHVRESHKAAAEQGALEGDSALVIDAKFVNGLRYPREAGAPAGEVINCRCSIKYGVKKWKD